MSHADPPRGLTPRVQARGLARTTHVDRREADAGGGVPRRPRRSGGEGDPGGTAVGFPYHRRVARERRGRRTAGWSASRQAIVDRLFVYGSLRTGQAARSLIANHVIGSQPATVMGLLYAVAD